ncbi:MAG: hypothetical protein K2H29_05400 [Oscillospiraceae bacterium]|nr:hypothetical protein [Oscillospiraceae bacterium]
MMKQKPDAMLMATFFTTCFYSATYPYIHKEIVQNVTENAVAYNQVANCISIILFSFLWNKYSDKLFRYYPFFCILECVIGIFTSAWLTMHPDHILTYYILDTLLFCLITRNIICGGVKLRSIRYPTEQQREHFDNSDNSAYALATIIGSLIAVCLDLDFIPMIWIATIGNMIDNIFYIVIFLNFQSKQQC